MARLRKPYLLFLLVLSFANSLLANEVAPNLKVAFLGDQGLSEEAHQVLKLVKAEGAELIIHQGDLDYIANPPLWEKMMTEELGDSFPVIAAVGNHDKLVWSWYVKLIEARLAKNPEVRCDGDNGINMTCEYKGLTVVTSGIGTKGDNHEEYLTKQLAQSESAWKICNWHKNMQLMQVGGKKDETGWEVYEICRRAGAIIATGHEHSYSRTHLMSSFKDQTIASKENKLVLEPEKTFAFVAGIGGRPIRDQNLSGDWWASIYTSTQKARAGALFCEFHINKNPRAAHCYLKNIDQQIVDEFYLETKL